MIAIVRARWGQVLRAAVCRIRNVSAYVALIQFVCLRGARVARRILQALEVYAEHLGLRPHWHIRQHLLAIGDESLLARSGHVPDGGIAPQCDE